MNNSNGTPNNEKKVFVAFYKKPKTMQMVEEETGVRRDSHICRYVDKWKKSKSIFIVKYGICPITKSGGVQFLTTNSMLIDKPKNKNRS